jgi:2,4-dienoyl-CoA reductase-like NADH-dependent reductase (Old Yellow Enzyme family)/thioredoxin reductase
MFEGLFKPFYIGKVEVPNRIVMPPMVVGFAGPHGEVTEQLLSHYEARARGGVGLVIVEASYISDSGKFAPGGLGIYGDELVPGLSRLADLIKIHGSRSAIQIGHGGIQAKAAEPVGPSSIGRRIVPPAKTPRELETAEVEGLVEDFACAALRAMQAGFDMVEVHGTHGYIITQFLSPLTNRRTDRYGADRALFAVEVVQRIKQVCGREYPVIFRLDADEFLEGGITVEQAKALARRLVEEAGVDAFDVTGGNYDTMDMLLMPYYFSSEQGWFLRHARDVKSVVAVPVISGGLIVDPKVAEEAIENGSVDAVFIGRQLIADPEWPRKVREGRLEDIRVCQACNEGCIGGRVFVGKPTWCAVNPLAGFEYRWPSDERLPKAPVKKNVVVVGGGPAGLETARVLALRGHLVTLIDEGESIGGTLRVASVPAFKKRIEGLLRWYEKQLRSLGVSMRMGTRANSELLRSLKPDVIVLATGSRPLVPGIPGVENAVMADDVLLGRVPVGGSVAVIGGGLVGVETALHLAMQGRKVSVVEALPEIARDLEPVSRIALLRPGGLLSRYGIRVYTSATVTRIEKRGVEVVRPPLERFFIDAESVVLAVGRTSNIDPSLISSAREIAKELYIIGDAKSPRKAIDAIHEGFFTALNI